MHGHAIHHVAEEIMFGTLIESHPTRQRRRGSAAVSAVVHVAIIAGALGTATHDGHGTPIVEHWAPDTVVYIPQSPVARPGTVIDDPLPGPMPRCDLCLRPPETIVPIPGPVTVDASPLDHLATSASDFGPARGPVVSNPFTRSGSAIGDPAAVYTGRQVEREVAVIDAPRPAYPEFLRAAGVEGRVVVRFVVDSTGRVEPSSIEVREASHPLFERAVRDALPRFRFAPAEVADRHVRQLVEMPFQFSLSNR